MTRSSPARLSLLRRFSNAMVSVPAIYDLVQTLAGQRKVAAAIRRVLAALPPGLALDVGSSGGRMSALLGIRPILVDIDLRPLLAARRRDGSPAVGANGGRLPFGDRSFDLTLCIFVSHHLLDRELDEVLDELERVTRGSMLFVDGVWSPGRPISRLMWRYDRGRHPRTRSALMHALEQRFEVAASDFAVYHQYLIAAARPREGFGLGSRPVAAESPE